MQGSNQLTQGNEAIAQGAFYAGARFYAGYPITPSSEIAEVCAKQLPHLGGVYVQMEDEIASMGAIIGASLAGIKSFTATSGPGFSLMQENLGMATIGEVPVVIVNVQRAGPSTGLATKPSQSDIMQMRWGRHGDQEVLVLMPATVRECFELTVQAFNLAEQFRVPVIVAPDEIVAHMRENFTMPQPGERKVIDRTRPDGSPEEYRPFTFEGGEVAPLAAYGSDYIFHITSSMHGVDGYSNNDAVNAAKRVRQLHQKIQTNRDKIVMVNNYDTENCETLIVAAGAVVRAARTAARQAYKVGVIQLITVWPFADLEILAAAKHAKTIVVAEMNYSGQLAQEVTKLFDGSVQIKKVNSYNGQMITPAQILKAMEQEAT